MMSHRDGSWECARAYLTSSVCRGFVCRRHRNPASIHLQAGGLDRTFPARDLLDDIFGKVLGPATLRRNTDDADIAEPCLDRGRVHRGMGRLVQPGHDLLRRAL